MSENILLPMSTGGEKLANLISVMSKYILGNIRVKISRDLYCAEGTIKLALVSSSPVENPLYCISVEY